jgi:hypothetical protein
MSHMSGGLTANPPRTRETNENGPRVAITSEQIRAARALLRWEQSTLEKRLGLP